MREEIIAATERLLLERQDAGAVSIRAIADAVGCTPPAIYMHFGDKTELIYEVCERHFQALDDLARDAAASSDDPLAALHAMGMAYVRFGLEHPEQYRVCFMSPIDEEMVPRLAEKMKDAARLELVVSAVSRCMEAGIFRRDDPYVVACGLWAMVHGLTSLLIAKPFFPWPEVERLVAHCIQTHAAGLIAND